MADVDFTKSFNSSKLFQPNNSNTFGTMGLPKDSVLHPDYGKKFLETSPEVEGAMFNNQLQMSMSTNPTTAARGNENVSKAISGAANLASTVGFSIDWKNGKGLGAGKKPGEKGISEKAGNAMAIAGAAFDTISSFLPDKTEYLGPKGNITQTMDSVYDGISDAAMAFGPIGLLVGGVMKGGKMLGKGMNAIGGGTDGQTTTDAILGSSFLAITPLGLINGFTGDNTRTIAKDLDAFNTVGASYTGTNIQTDDALAMADKKYGGLSRKAMRAANRQINEADFLQLLMAQVAQNSLLTNALKDSMSAINANRLALAMLGGFDFSNVSVGKKGLKLSPKQSKEILEKRKPKDPFEEYLVSLPENLRDSTNFRVRDYWEFNGRPKDFEEAKNLGLFELDGDPYYAAENPDTGELEFMIPSSHPSIQEELDWYNSDEGSEFRNNYELLKTEPYWKYVKRTVPYKKLGGIIPTLIELVSLEEIELFAKGGSINVIPEGALHARKHNMDIEGITKKGIPVVSEDENGEIEQHAEIEQAEIIYRLEVTLKLEELLKEYYKEATSNSRKDELALEAGKLLVEETLYNTKDNTNKLL